MFSVNDLVAFAGIVGVDLVMSGDNAVIIAMASQQLPQDMRVKVMLWGSLAAVVLRIAAASVVVTLLKLPYLQLMGGLVLVWIAYKLMMQPQKTENGKSVSSIWSAIKVVVLADFIMSIDNVLALAAVAQTSSQYAYLFLIIGLLMSIPLLMFGSNFISRMLDHYPLLVYVGAGILLYAAGGLITGDLLVRNTWIGSHRIWIQGILMLVILTIGYWRKPGTTANPEIGA